MPLATPHPYTLQLPEFEGPLDLLLRLIEQQQLAITAISLSMVADQYLAHVQALADPDPATVADFLALAAQLLLIKSRALLPRPAASPPPAEESAEELARQLRDYRRFKDLAAQLRELEQSGRRTWTRQGPPLPALAPPPLQPQAVGALVAALERRLQLLGPPPPAPLSIPQPREITIADVAARLHEILAAHSFITFVDLLNLSTTRAEVIVTLWTVLELFKRGVITVEQPELFAEISLGRGPRFGEDWGVGGAEGG